MSLIVGVRRTGDIHVKRLEGKVAVITVAAQSDAQPLLHSGVAV